MELSTDINKIETEIQFYKELAGVSVWEIGRRLNYVKDNNLAHGEFGYWLEKIGINHPEANRMMRVAKELPSNSSTLKNLGSTALYLIATLPEEEKQVELKKAEAGEASTVKELRELKRQLKEKDKQIDSLSETIYELNARPPETITKTVTKEVKPPDYDDLKSDYQQVAEANQSLNKQLQQVNFDLKFMQNKYSLLESSTKEARELEATIKQMRGEKNRLQSLFDLSDKTMAINQFFDKEMASIRFKPLVDIIQTEQAFKDLQQTVAIVAHWVDEMESILPNEYIKEAEIVEVINNGNG